MGKMGTRLPGFCLNRIRPHVRVRSSQIRSGPAKDDQNSGNAGGNDAGEEKRADNAAAEKPAAAAPAIGNGRKIMIVVDSSMEAKGAAQWVLSHTVQNGDSVVLLYVTRTLQKGEIDVAPRVYELLYSMKNMFQLKKPEAELQIQVVAAEAKEKGPTIVEQAKKQGVTLLVLGQKKRSMTWRLLMMWAGHRTGASAGAGMDAVEYCIQNANCMAIAVRRKSNRTGGYLITTKRHKDFWLLA